MLSDLLQRNRDWAEGRSAAEPEFFARLAVQQVPEFFLSLIHI